MLKCQFCVIKIGSRASETGRVNCQCIHSCAILYACIWMMLRSTSDFVCFAVAQAHIHFSHFRECTSTTTGGTRMISHPRNAKGLTDTPVFRPNHCLHLKWHDAQSLLSCTCTQCHFHSISSNLCAYSINVVQMLGGRMLSASLSDSLLCEMVWKICIVHCIRCAIYQNLRVLVYA